MNIPFSPPDITDMEINEVSDALRSGWITTGARTKELESRIASYTGATCCVCLNSDTAAMEMTLRILGIGPGDQVITTAYTYTATAAVIHHVGAEIVLVDTEPDSFELNYDMVEQAITDRTKVIIPVDIGGRLCNYQRLMDIVERKKNFFKSNSPVQDLLGRIAILSDSAHGFGGKRGGKPSGSLADFTCFSFHAVKNLTTGEGGAVVWRDLDDLDSEVLYREYMLLSLHGQSKDALSKTKAGSWEYDILYPGYKCNMTDIQAAIGLSQLNRYEGLLARRRAVIERYDEEFLSREWRPLIHFDEISQSSGHLYLLRIPGIGEKERNHIIEKMSEVGISTNVHYKPLPMMTAYKKMGFSIGDYPKAFAMYENEISLPLHTKLTEEEVEYICHNISRIGEEAFGL